MFRFLKCCCDIICPPCPYPYANLRGWKTRPIPTCPQCPGCPPCPFPYANQTGYTDSNFLLNCPRCPKCEDNPCYRSSVPGEPCPCMPTKWLVTLVGVNCNCPCFENVCPPGASFPEHNESSGDYSVSFCAPGSATVGATENRWGNDGPTCAPPATLLASGATGSISAGPGTDPLGNPIFSINAISPLGNAVFRGSAPIPCKNTIIIANTISGCQTVCDPINGSFIEIIESSGGYAIVQPCGC